MPRWVRLMEGSRWSLTDRLLSHSTTVNRHRLSTLPSSPYKLPYPAWATIRSVRLEHKTFQCHHPTWTWSRHGIRRIKIWAPCNIPGSACRQLLATAKASPLASPFSGIPHLAVSNSTPPPSSSSPAPVKIKAEPISPPRDQLLSQHQQQSIVTSLGGSSSIGGITYSSASLGSNLNHSHLMNSRPSSTGHLTPTPGECLLFC